MDHPNNNGKSIQCPKNPNKENKKLIPSIPRIDTEKQFELLKNKQEWQLRKAEYSINLEALKNVKQLFTTYLQDLENTHQRLKTELDTLKATKDDAQTKLESISEYILDQEFSMLQIEEFFIEQEEKELATKNASLHEQ